MYLQRSIGYARLRRRQLLVFQVARHPYSPLALSSLLMCSRRITFFAGYMAQPVDYARLTAVTPNSLVCSRAVW